MGYASRTVVSDGKAVRHFMQHFRGGMDHWEPAVTDGFAKNRPVILFDNAGVAASSGETPDTIDAMAEHAADFVGALGLSQIDLLGSRLADISRRPSRCVILTLSAGSFSSAPVRGPASRLRIPDMPNTAL